MDQLQSQIENKIRILIVDDHPLIREGIRCSLKKYPEFDFIGEASDGESALNEVESYNPNLILMDIKMPGALNGIEACRRIKSKFPQIAILILSVSDDENLIKKAIEAGAQGYVSKESNSENIKMAILELAKGNVYYDTKMKPQTLKNSQEQKSVLSPRESEILVYICEGLRNKDIAKQVQISKRTVEAHRSQIMKKLKIDNVAGLTLYAINQGLLSSDLL